MIRAPSCISATPASALATLLLAAMLLCTSQIATAGKLKSASGQGTGQSKSESKSRDTSRPRSGKSKLREFERAASGRETARNPSAAPPPGNNAPRGGSRHRDGRRHRGYYYGGYPYLYHRPYHRPVFSNRYCRRLSLFEQIMYPNYLYRDRCLVRRHPRPSPAPSGSEAELIETPVVPTETLPLEDLRVSRMLEPSIRLDFASGELDSTLELKDYGLAVGYQMFSLSFQRSTLVEDYFEDGVAYRDNLNIEKLLLNVRMRFGSFFAVEAGAGSYDMDGVFNYSENAIRLGGKWHDPSGFGIEYYFTDTLTNELKMTEDELSLFYGFDNISMKLGYRNLHASRLFDLNYSGTFFGFSASF